MKSQERAASRRTRSQPAGSKDRSGGDEEPTAVLREGGARNGAAGSDPVALAGGGPEVAGQIRDPSFSVAMRGYDRREVDAYVERVNALIAELELGRSPQSAIRAALDRVAEQTASVLQSAREAAEDVTATAIEESGHLTRRARVEAEELLERARAEAVATREHSAGEAEELLAQAREQAAACIAQAEDQAEAIGAQAQTRLRSLREELGRAAARRRRVIDELRRTAAELEAFATASAARERADADLLEEPAPDSADVDPGSDLTREGHDAETRAGAQEEGAELDAETVVFEKSGSGVAEWAASAAHSD